MWAARVESGCGVGSGTVLSSTLVLTCAHVVGSASAVRIRIGDDFEMFNVVDTDTDLDLALLTAATSKKLPPESVLIPRELWRGAAPDSDRTTVELWTADPDTPRSLPVIMHRAGQWSRRVQFRVSGDREGVRAGNSGAPVVEHREGIGIPRVLGIVRARDELSLDPFDRAGVGWMVPVDRIAERFDQVAALVESPIEREVSWGEHWEPRSRGVATSTDSGFFFSGRERAFACICDHLDRGSGLLAVTGERGRGKSALLARAVTLSCRRYLGLVRADDEATARLFAERPIVVDSAVLARGQSAKSVAQAIALHLGFGPRTAEELVHQCRIAARPPSVVIDAVDECDDPHMLLRDVVVKLVDVGARVAIGGLRRRIFLDVPQQTTWVDLDGTQFGDDAVLTYIERRLRAGTYDEQTALTVAPIAAVRTRGNFLVAELVARTLASRPPIDTSAPGWVQQLPRDMTDAFREYLGRFGSGRERVLALLHPLAHAMGDGLTVDPPDAWLAMANALRPDHVEPFEASDLREAARRAGDYLIATAGRGARRMYHQGLAEAVRQLVATDRVIAAGLVPEPDAIRAETVRASRECLEAMLALLPSEDPAAVEHYAAIDPYLLQHIATHLADQGRAGELLERPGLLLVCDAASLRAALIRGALQPRIAEPARAVVQALREPHNTPRDRAAALCSALRRQGEARRADVLRRALSSQPHVALPYELVSGPPLPAAVSTIGAAHRGPIAALAFTEDEAGPLVISGSHDGAFRSWRVDGTPGALVREHAHEGGNIALRHMGYQGPGDGHIGAVRAIAITRDRGEPLIVTAGDDRALRSWRLDGRVGPLVREDAHTAWIRALLIVDTDPRPLVVSAGDDGALRSWTIDGTPGPIQCDDTGTAVAALVAAEHEGRVLIVSAGFDGALRSWNIDGTRGQLWRERAHRDSIGALVSATYNNTPIIVSSGYDAIKSWYLDGRAGPFERPTAHDGWIGSLALIEQGGDPLLVSAGDDGAIRSWRLDGRPGPVNYEHAHRNWIRALASPVGDNPPLLVSGGYDCSVRSWLQHRTDASTGRDDAHGGWIRAVTVVEDGGRHLFISTGDDCSIRSWYLDGSRGPIFHERAHTASIRAIAIGRHGNQPLLITAGDNGSVRSSHFDGSPGLLTLERAHTGTVRALVVVRDGHRCLVITAGDDQAIRSWYLDGASGPLAVEGAHDGAIRALSVVEHDGAPVVVSAGDDRAVRTWHLDGTQGPLHRVGAHDMRSRRAGEEAARVGSIRTLAVARHEGRPIIISGGDDGKLCGWRIDDGGVPLVLRRSGYAIHALAVVPHSTRDLVVTAGEAVTIDSYYLDGTPGPLTAGAGHTDWIRALAGVATADGNLVVSAGDDRTVVAHRID